MDNTLDETTRTQLEALRSGTRDQQNQAYMFLLEATEQPVGWAYAAWDAMVADLTHKDNHRRAIAAQVLANLARHSDPEGRIRGDFPALLNVTRDERYVTARHAMQSIWKVGAAGEAQRAMVVEGLERRFHECAAEKNGTLTRYDIIQGLRSLYDAVGDGTVDKDIGSIREKALALIATVEDAKYRKQYASVWK